MIFFRWCYLACTNEIGSIGVFPFLYHLFLVVMRNIENSMMPPSKGMYDDVKLVTTNGTLSQF